jgi:hypothetical protein
MMENVAKADTGVMRAWAFFQFYLYDVDHQQKELQ